MAADKAACSRVDLSGIFAGMKKKRAAIGSIWHGKQIGSFGDFDSFSFQANHNIAAAEGGCQVLNNT